MDWTEDIDHVLNNIRINCILLNKAHKKRYFELKNSLKYYRLPVILSATWLVLLLLNTFTRRNAF